MKTTDTEKLMVVFMLPIPTNDMSVIKTYAPVMRIARVLHPIKLIVAEFRSSRLRHSVSERIGGDGE